jgi:NitT/TauT family transport system substrate-binding protein
MNPRSLIPLALAGALLALNLAPVTAAGPEKVSMILNWVAGGDHAPYYYAQKMGWYKDAGIDLTLEQGKGSALAAQKVGAGVDQFGLSDMGTVLQARGKGADDVAILNVYANFPEGFYWLKSSGIKSLKDLVGKKIGNPPGDAGRVIWPALAKANHIDPNSITWVNIEPAAKLTALKTGAVDAVTEFFNLHHVYAKELGTNMGYLAWKDDGVNPYGNSVIVNGDYLRAHRDTVAAFTKVTQRAFGFCSRTPDPCIAALVEANSGLSAPNELQNWHEVAELMSDPVSQTVALGWMDPKRMAASYQLVKDYMGIDTPFAPTAAYTNDFLSKTIKAPVVKDEQ